MNWFRKAKQKVEDIIHPEVKEVKLNFEGLTQQQLEYMFKYGVGSNKLGPYESKPFMDLPYGVVRLDLITLQKKELHIEVIKLILECQFDKVNLSGISQNDLFSFLIWIKKQQERMFKIEELYLSSEPDPEAIASGIHKLDEFGALATIHSLAQGKPWRHKDIYNTPYFEIYTILKLEKVNRDIQKAHQKIVEQKAKSK